jgi:hypothetical protein
MCIEEISASETDSDTSWESYIDKENISISEINGRRCHIKVIHEKNTFVDSINKKGFITSSLAPRSIIHKSSASAIMRPIKAGGRVEGGFTIEWGGEEGTSWSGSVAAEAYDDKGNYAKIEVKQDNDGKGKAEVSAGHKEESK